MVLAASEDKTYRGASIASPTMPWIWGTMSLETDHRYSGPYHLVWPRDFYHVATAQKMAGDDAAADRLLDYLWDVQKPAGEPCSQGLKRRCTHRLPVADLKKRGREKPPKRVIRETIGVVVVGVELSQPLGRNERNRSSTSARRTYDNVERARNAVQAIDSAERRFSPKQISARRARRSCHRRPRRRC